jgi:hypothetical protein
MFTKKLLLVLVVLSADAAWETAGAFWGFTILAFVALWAAMNAMSANPAANHASAKAYSVEARLNAHVVAAAPAINLVANGGTVNGNLYTAGDHHVGGNLYGSGGTLPVGDTAQFNASGNGPTGGNTFLGLTNSQASFLGGQSQMSGEGSQSLGTDGFGGGVWTASQASSLSTLQGLLNATTGGLNNLIARLISNGYMA